jgi:hypothetical protein
MRRDPGDQRPGSTRETSDDDPDGRQPRDRVARGRFVLRAGR